MELFINNEELTALCELPHLQQLAYLRGIKPYMDFKTGIVGIKRKISHQSIAEQLYVAPHQGIKSVTVTKIQVRRAIWALERAGLITIESEGMQLIVRCVLADMDYSVSKKEITARSYQADTVGNSQHTEKNSDLGEKTKNVITGKTAKVITPPIDPLYLSFLENSFEAFWSLYPEKKSRAQAFKAFEALSLDDALMEKMLNGLKQQIEYYDSRIVQNQWVASWKYPAKWLTQRCWEDEIKIEQKETRHANTRKNTRKQSRDDFSWLPDDIGDSGIDDIGFTGVTGSDQSPNVFAFKRV